MNIEKLIERLRYLDAHDPDADVTPFKEAANAIETLQGALKQRDDFISDIGYWQKFVSADALFEDRGNLANVGRNSIPKSHRGEGYNYVD